MDAPPEDFHSSLDTSVCDPGRVAWLGDTKAVQRYWTSLTMGATMRHTRGFMLDTCVINRVLDQKVSADAANAWTPRFVTDIQLQELAQTPNLERREALLAIFFALGPSIVRVGVPIRHHYDFVDDFGAVGLDHDYQSAHLSLGRLVPPMAVMLSGKPKRTFRDAFIAEAALLNRFTLVTADAELAEMAVSFGIDVEVVP